MGSWEKRTNRCAPCPAEICVLGLPYSESGADGCVGYRSVGVRSSLGPHSLHTRCDEIRCESLLVIPTFGVAAGDTDTSQSRTLQRWVKHFDEVRSLLAIRKHG
jgi:hypothetical protein